MSMMNLNGLETSPSSYTWGLKDNSASDAGRVQDENDTMYKNRTSQKRTLNVAWNGLTPSTMSSILQAVNSEYFPVTYPDALSGNTETRTFYVGDRTAPIKIWTVNNKRYEQLTFNLIER